MIITGLAESGLTVAQIYDGYNVAKGGKDLLEKSTGHQLSDDLVEEAQRLYPRKAGKIEKHHITPQYLGGNKYGPVAPIDASYHQVITNDFRSYWRYGQNFRNEAKLKKNNEESLFKIPLPAGN